MSSSLAKRVKVWFTPLYEQLPEQCFPVQSRAFQGFCVGMPKTGTVSIAKMFEQHHRSEHEPEIRFFSHHVLQYLHGRDSRSEMQAYLNHRDKRMQLEMDSSYLNSEIVDLLVDAFPNAKFVLTIRDCFSWLESFINFQLLKSSYFTWRRPHVKRYVDYCFQNMEYSYDAEEEFIRDHNLIPIEHCFYYWRNRNEFILNNVPKDRLLVIRTDQIDNCGGQLEHFFQLPSGSLANQVRANITIKRAKERIIDTMPKDYLIRKATEQQCGELMQSIFPDIWNKWHLH